MQHGEGLWGLIRHQHCCFMSKIETGNFCRNPYNVTGICNRSSCPLANARYATIRDHDGVFYLYMKTIERAHMPAKLWERVKLSQNYDKALETIDKHMMYWPKLLVHKIKQRLTKMTQMRIRMRKLALKTREKIMTTPRKEKKRDARRLEKAEKAARIDKKIEEELLERLKNKVYPDEIETGVKMYNINEDSWRKFLKDHEMEEEDEEEPEVEYVEGYEELEEEDDMEDFGTFAMDDSLGDGHNDELDKDDDDDMEVDDSKRTRKESRLASKIIERNEPGSKSGKKARVLVEVEHEDGGHRQTAVQ